MRLIVSAVIVCFIISLLFPAVPAPARAQAPTTATPQKKEPANDLVYADFETTKNATKDDRPASSRGGIVQLFSYQQNAAAPPKFKGLAGADPPAPELVRLVKDDPNAAAAFEFELFEPNQYAGVIMAVNGLPEKENGKTAADDVSGYSYLTLQASATGVSSLAVEFLSRGQGIELNVGSPQATIQIQPGFKVYQIPLTSLAQPSWAPVKVNPTDVLKKLTGIIVIASCGPCAATKGRVVVDNFVFHP